MHIILLLIALVIGAVGGYFTGVNTSKSSESATTTQQTVFEYDPGEAVLPTESVRVSSCIPRMGYHWTRLEHTGLDRGFGGPTYNVWENRIIGLEYHLPITNADGFERSYILGKAGELDLFNARINHVTFGAVPEGHGGVPQPHWDAHFYLVSPEEVAAITCVNAPAPATPSATAR